MSVGNSTDQLEKVHKGKAQEIRVGRDFMGPNRTEAPPPMKLHKLNRAGETYFPNRQNAKRTHASNSTKQGVYTMTEKMIENRIKKL